MIVMGVDPHITKPYAITVIDGEKVMGQHQCNLQELYNHIASYRVDLVAVEDQYMSRNFKTAKGLAWSAGRVMAAAELSEGTKCAVINVAKWKARFGVMKGGHREVSVACGGKDHDDLASSHLIALYASEVGYGQQG